MRDEGSISQKQKRKDSRKETDTRAEKATQEKRGDTCDSLPHSRTSVVQRILAWSKLRVDASPIVVTAAAADTFPIRYASHFERTARQEPEMQAYAEVMGSRVP